MIHPDAPREEGRHGLVSIYSLGKRLQGSTGSGTQYGAATALAERTQLEHEIEELLKNKVTG